MVLVSRQLEIKARTKYFYLDRSPPKKKLSRVEMVETKPWRI